MKSLIVCSAIAILVLAGWYSLFGRALRASIGEHIHEATSPAFDVRVAKEAVRDLRLELHRDYRSLAELSRSLERGQQRLNTLREGVSSMAAHIEAGAKLLAQEPPYHVHGRELSRSEVEQRLETSLARRAQYRRQQEQLERHLAVLHQKKAEMDAAFAAKRSRLDDYEAQIAVVKIDARFRSVADRFEVHEGKHRIQELIDRISDQLAVDQAVTGNATSVNFLEAPSDLNQRIREELAAP